MQVWMYIIYHIINSWFFFISMLPQFFSQFVFMLLLLLLFIFYRRKSNIHFIVLQIYLWALFLIPYLFFILLSLWVFLLFQIWNISNEKETLPMYTKTHFYSKTADHINAAAARMEWNYWKNNKKKNCCAHKKS